MLGAAVQPVGTILREKMEQDAVKKVAQRQRFPEMLSRRNVSRFWLV